MLRSGEPNLLSAGRLSTKLMTAADTVKIPSHAATTRSEMPPVAATMFVNPQDLGQLRNHR